MKEGTTAEPKSRYWDRQAARYDRVIRVLNRRFVSQIGELVKPYVVGRQRVLEVGGGTGLVSQYLTGASTLIVSDISDGMLRMCRDRLSRASPNRVLVIKADVHGLPFRAGSFDVVVCANVLHLLPVVEGVLIELMRVVKLGGHLLAPTFCHGQNSLTKVVSRGLSLAGFPVVQRFSQQSLAKTLQDHGLELVEAKLLAGTLPVLWLVGRDRSRLA